MAIIIARKSLPVVCHPYIGDCHYYDDIVGKCNLTLICVQQQPQSTTLLNANIKSICRNQHLYHRYTDGFSKYWIGTIGFQDCQHLEMPSKLFAVYDRVHTVDISNMSIASLKSDNFTAAKRLTRIIASHNQIDKIDSDILPIDNHVEYFDISFNNLTNFNVNSLQRFGELKQLYVHHNRIQEIPSFLFHKTEKLAIVDLSFNLIERIDNFVFSGAANLNRLNLSHNHLNALHGKIFDKFITNLTHLDLSWNRIANLSATYSFVNVEMLIYLDVSGNPLISLSNQTFGDALQHLQQLFLSQTSLKSIERGTFAHLLNLKIVDLSGNQLIQLNVDIFGGQTTQLRWLSVTANRLRELNGFTATAIPNAKIIGIDQNRFNCTYFERIFAEITWKHLDAFSKRINCSTTIEIDEDRIECAANLIQSNQFGSGTWIALTVVNAFCLSAIVLAGLWTFLRNRIPTRYRFHWRNASEPLTNDIEIGD